MSSSKTLIVGGGAVGQVFGLHLQRAGRPITFLVKPGQLALATGTWPLYPLNTWRRGAAAQRLTDFDVVSSLSDVAARGPWNLVIVTVASHALVGNWLRPLIAAVGQATVVSLQPGDGDRDFFLSSGVDPSRLISGMIGFIAYQAPLAGSAADAARFPERGIAYWLPPGSPCLFSGPSHITEPFVKTLRSGGLPARKHRNVPAHLRAPNALLTAFMLGLESAGWSAAALDWERTAIAAQQALTITSRDAGQTARPLRHLVHPIALKAFFALASRIVPFDLASYLRAHFTKVRQQTHLSARQYIASAKRQGCRATELEALYSSCTNRADAS